MTQNITAFNEALTTTVNDWLYLVQGGVDRKIHPQNLPGLAAAVSGPASAVDNRIAVFDGITGKLLKDGGNTIAGMLAACQPASAQLSELAAINPAEADIIQNKSNVWVNRTPAQFKIDLNLTKADVGLGNVDNTSDANKPISNADQAALNAKQDLLVNSAGLRAAVNDPTGTGSAVFANTATLTSPNMVGIPTAVSLNIAANGFLQFATDIGLTRAQAGPQQAGNVLKVTDAGQLGWFWTRRIELGNDPFYTPGSIPLGGGNYHHNIRSNVLVSGNPDSYDKWEGLTSWILLKGLTASNVGPTDYYGLTAEVGSDPTNTFNLWQIFGINCSGYTKGSGNVTGAVHGSYSRCEILGTGTIASARGANAWLRSTSSSTITDGKAFYAIISNENAAGHIVTAAGLDIQLNSNLGVIDTFYGIRIRTGANTGSIGSRFGLYVEDQNIVGTTSVFQIYSAGLQASKFEGPVIIGTLNAAPVDAKLSNNTTQFYLDEAANRLKARVKYSTGVLHTVDMPLDQGVSSALGVFPLLPNPVVKNLRGPDVGSTADIYTVPAGRRLLFLNVIVFNTSGAAITFVGQIKIAGLYYSLATGASCNPGAGQIISGQPIILEAGETICLYQSAVGLNSFLRCIEFDATSGFKTGKKVDLALGDNTVYTVPAGKSTMLFNQSLTSLAAYSSTFQLNTSAATRTLSEHVTPAGSVVSSIANRIFAPFAINASAFIFANTFIGSMASGESFVVNADAAMTGLVWMNVFEQ
jgi:hypothetical protein